MGLFDVYCGLTNFPIQSGHEVVAVVFDNSFIKQDYYVSIDHIRRVVYGSYNRYGWLDEYEDDDPDYINDPDVMLCFFHRSAWEAVLSFQRLVRPEAILSYEKANGNTIEHFSECCHVLLAAQRLGINIASVPASKFNSQEAFLPELRRLVQVEQDLLSLIYDEDDEGDADVEIEDDEDEQE